MDFKINALQRPANTAKYQEIARKTAISASQAQQADKVDVSESARMFKSLLNTVREMPDVRMNKIEAVKEQIDAGSYHVDSRAIAEKMLGYIARK